MEKVSIDDAIRVIEGYAKGWDVLINSGKPLPFEKAICENKRDNQQAIVDWLKDYKRCKKLLKEKIL